MWFVLFYFENITIEMKMHLHKLQKKEKKDKRNEKKKKTWTNVIQL